MLKRGRSAVGSRWFYLLVATGVCVVSFFCAVLKVAAQDTERVTPITAPVAAFPDENASRGVTKYSFIAYGDTRGRRREWSAAPTLEAHPGPQG